MEEIAPTQSFPSSNEEEASRGRPNTHQASSVLKSSVDSESSSPPSDALKVSINLKTLLQHLKDEGIEENTLKKIEVSAASLVEPLENKASEKEEVSIQVESSGTADAATSKSAAVHTAVEAKASPQLAEPKIAPLIHSFKKYNSLGSEVSRSGIEQLKRALEASDDPHPDIDNFSYLYNRLLSWARGALDAYRSELLDICFAVFVEMYIRLFHSDPISANRFFKINGWIHAAKFGKHLASLKNPRHPAQLQDFPFFSAGQSNGKSVIYLTKNGLRALNSWLVECDSALLLNMIQQCCEFRLVSSSSRNLKTSSLSFDLAASIASLNKRKISWGLPKALYFDDSISSGSFSSSASCIGGEPTELVEADCLLPLPEPGTEIYSFYRANLKKCSENRMFLSRDALPCALAYSLQNSYELCSLCISPFDGAFVAAAYEDSSIRLWNIAEFERRNASNLAESAQDGTPVQHTTNLDNSSDWNGCDLIYGHEGGVYGMAFGENNTVLLTGGCDGSIALWSLDSKTPCVNYRGGNTTVWSVDFAPFGYYFASGENDHLARLWVTDRSFPLRVLVGHTSDVDVVKFHPNSGLLVTGSSDGTLRVWDLRTSECVRILSSPDKVDAFHTVAVSRNGRLIASSAQDHLISVWDLANGELVGSLNGHTERVRSLDFSHGSSLLASGSTDCSVALWDISKISGADVNVSNAERSAGRDSAAACYTLKMPLASRSGGGGYIDSSQGTRTPPAAHSFDNSPCVARYRYFDAQIQSLSFTPENVLLVGAVSVQCKA